MASARDWIRASRRSATSTRPWKPASRSRSCRCPSARRSMRLEQGRGPSRRRCPTRCIKVYHHYKRRRVGEVHGHGHQLGSRNLLGLPAVDRRRAGPKGGSTRTIMCGIAGLIPHRGQSADIGSRNDRDAAALKHRGPGLDRISRSTDEPNETTSTSCVSRWPSRRTWTSKGFEIHRSDEGSQGRRSTPVSPRRVPRSR